MNEIEEAKKNYQQLEKEKDSLREGIITSLRNGAYKKDRQQFLEWLNGFEGKEILSLKDLEKIERAYNSFRITHNMKRASVKVA